MATHDEEYTSDQEVYWQNIYSFYRKAPALYSLIVLLAAGIGFAYIFIFPAATAYALYNLLSVFPIANTNDGLVLMIVWGLVTVATAIVTGNVIALKIPPLKGVKLEYPMAQKLHDMLAEIDQQFKIPQIDNIVVTEQVTIEIIKPLYPITRKHKKYSIDRITGTAMPVPEYLKCAITRKMMLYANKNHVVAKWLHQMRQCWMQYLNAFLNDRRISNFIHIGFFNLYAPFYHRLATPIAYMQELRADTESMELLSDEDLLQTMESILVTKIYLDQQYWPRIQRKLYENNNEKPEPYSQLDSLLQNELTARTSKRWLDAIYQHDANRITAIPDLKTRMDNLGCNKIRIPEKVQQTAGQYFLAKDYSHVVSEMNQMWLQNQYEPMTNLPKTEQTSSVEQLLIDGASLVLPSTLHKDIFYLS